MAVGWSLDIVLLPRDFIFQITACDWKFNKYWVIHFSCVFFAVLYGINGHVGRYKCVTKLTSLHKHKTLKLMDVRPVFSAS